MPALQQRLRSRANLSSEETMINDLPNKLYALNGGMLVDLAAAHIEQLERDLKTVLDREAATYERHEAKVEALERERDASTLRIKQLSDALEHARDSLLWCARGGRMASHGLEQYPEKWAASATAVLEQRG